MRLRARTTGSLAKYSEYHVFVRGMREVILLTDRSDSTSFHGYPGLSVGLTLSDEAFQLTDRKMVFSVRMY